MRLRAMVIFAAVAAAIPVLVLSLAAVTRTRLEVSGDYMTYVGGAARVLQGEPLYTALQLDGPYGLDAAAWGAGFVYPPSAALMFVPTAVVAPAVGYIALVVGSAIGLGALVALIGRREGMTRPWAAAFGIGFMLLAPAIEAVSVGQANTVIAIFLAASWLWPRVSGYLAVAGGLLKVFPIVGLAWTIRERQPMLRPVLIGAGVVAVTILWMGPGTWFDFVTSLRNGQGSDETLVLAPRRLIAPLLGETISGLALMAAAGIVTLASLRVRSRYAAFAMVTVAMILPAPDWHYHYLLIPQVGIAPWVASKLMKLPAAWRAAATPTTMTPPTLGSDRTP
jgi:hypothetical protein